MSVVSNDLCRRNTAFRPQWPDGSLSVCLRSEAKITQRADRWVHAVVSDKKRNRQPQLPVLPRKVPRDLADEHRAWLMLLEQTVCPALQVDLFFTTAHEGRVCAGEESLPDHILVF